MRLIDAEHLKWNVGGIKCGLLTVAYLDWILEHEEPTVDAIPIEWLQAHITTIEQQRLLDEWAERKEE